MLLAMQALRTGYTSIMIDGSHGTFEENIEVSKAVVDACHPSGVPDTDPQEAKQFVDATGVDSLGNAHEEESVK